MENAARVCTVTLTRNHVATPDVLKNPAFEQLTTLHWLIVGCRLKDTCCTDVCIICLKFQLNLQPLYNVEQGCFEVFTSLYNYFKSQRDLDAGDTETQTLKSKWRQDPVLEIYRK